MTADERDRFDMIALLVANGEEYAMPLEDTEFLIGLARALDQRTTIKIETKPVEGPPPLFYMLQFRADMTLPDGVAGKFLDIWDKMFDGNPPAPLVVLQPGCELVFKKNLDGVPEEDGAAMCVKMREAAAAYVETFAQDNETVQPSFANMAAAIRTLPIQQG